MSLTGLHFLLTYQCIGECDHCFVWSSPNAKGTFTLAQIRDVYRQAKELGTITDFYFEGGEPFLYYAVLVEAVREAAEAGFRAGIVSNPYWATSVEDAETWLRPFVGKLADLSISTDLFHGDEMVTPEARNGIEAARRLGFPIGTISIETPEGCASYPARAKGEPVTGGAVMFRGRAVAKLVEGVPRRPWREFNECPHEDLANPSRVHLDSFGNLHLCQGLVMGNLFHRPLKEIVATYDPKAHPIVGPLIEGGPAALVEKYDLSHEEAYVDACHLCYTAREALRSHFPDILAPDQMYGVGV
jgi:MoaA/NifB/PqqE/SkfB family radical SAM enzyme